MRILINVAVPYIYHISILSCTLNANFQCFIESSHIRKQLLNVEQSRDFCVQYSKQQSNKKNTHNFKRLLLSKHKTNKGCKPTSKEPHNQPPQHFPNAP